MTPTPLALTELQLQIVRCQEKKLRKGWHGRYRELVADRLLGLDELTDDDVRFHAIDVMERIKSRR